MSPTDFLAISTAPKRATFDCDMRDGMAPLNEDEAAENETAAESIVLGCRGGCDLRSPQESSVSDWTVLLVIYILRCVAGRRLPWAGRAGRRLNDKESLMVHWGRPTTPAMARQHKLQLALLLEMDKKESAQHQVEMIVGLLPG